MQYTPSAYFHHLLPQCSANSRQEQICIASAAEELRRELSSSIHHIDSRRLKLCHHFCPFVCSRVHKIYIKYIGRNIERSCIDIYLVLIRINLASISACIIQGKWKPVTERC